MAKKKLKLYNMPWGIIAVPVIICLIWGFKNGLKSKADRSYKKPSDLW